MLELELVRELEKRAENHRSVAGRLQHRAPAQQDGISDAGRVHGERCRVTGVSTHAGRLHPNMDQIELAGDPEYYNMTGPKTLGRVKSNCLAGRPGQRPL